MSAPQNPSDSPVTEVARRAGEAAAELAPLPRTARDGALAAIADALTDPARTEEIVASNAEDVARARAAGTPESVVDRLTLTPERIEAIAADVRQVVALPDPVGEVVRGSTLPNGLQLRQVRVPLGVVGIVYEARPNVTVDAAALCLKSGNAALLRGSSSAYASNTALVSVLRDAVAAAGLPADAVQLVPGEGRESVSELMRARGLVDVLIPRGGASLIATVVEESSVPVIETGTGNCHIYVDEWADQRTAVDILVNSKAQRPSVCNAAETVLVHEAVAETFVPRALAALSEAGVTVHGDSAWQKAGASAGAEVVPATEEDWATEYLSHDIAAAVVPSLEAAVRHIREWSSGHTEAIVTRDTSAANRFTSLVDSTAVMVNASTRFTDGGQFGFGAEIGISTQKLHARGPMGLPELTSTKYVVTGEGHTRRCPTAPVPTRAEERIPTRPAQNARTGLVWAACRTMWGASRPRTARSPSTAATAEKRTTSSPPWYSTRTSCVPRTSMSPRRRSGYSPPLSTLPRVTLEAPPRRASSTARTRPRIGASTTPSTDRTAVPPGIPGTAPSGPTARSTAPCTTPMPPMNTAPTTAICTSAPTATRSGRTGATCGGSGRWRGCSPW